MITFGFKNKFSGWLRSISAIVLGIIVVAHPTTALDFVVKVLAAFLIASGIVSLGYGIINRQRGVLPLMITNAAVNFVIGILLFYFSTQVASFMLILIGLAILLCGIWEFIVLASAAKVTHAGFVAFIFPILCIAFGAILLTKSGEVTRLITVIAGIALIVYGVSEFLATWRMNRAMKAQNLKSGDEGKAEASEDISEAKEAEFEKVEEEPADCKSTGTETEPADCKSTGTEEGSTGTEEGSAGTEEESTGTETTDEESEDSTDEK